MHRKMMDHAQQPGSADRLPPATPLSCDETSLEEYSWHARRDRTPRCRLLGDVQWPFLHLAKALPAIDRRLSWRSRSEWRIRLQDRGHKSGPISADRYAHRPTAR